MAGLRALSALAHDAAHLTGVPQARVELALRPLVRHGLIVGVQHRESGEAWTGAVWTGAVWTGAAGPGRWTGAGDAPGQARRGDKVGDDVREVASVTKPFTAALLGRLASSDRVDPLAPVAELGGLFHSFPEWVTPYALVTHTAGLPPHPLRTGLTAVLDPFAPYGRLSAEAAAASARRWAAPARSGHFGYSNLGAGALGLALAQAGGQAFGPLLAQEVTGPLRLGHTGFPAYVPPGGTDFGVLAGAGGLWSTAPELLRFAQAHLRGNLGAGWTQCITPPGLPSGVDEVAPGWFVSRGVWWHDGVARRSRAGLAFHPASGWAAALLVGGPLGLRRTDRPAVRRALLALLPD